MKTIPVAKLYGQIFKTTSSVKRHMERLIPVLTNLDGGTDPNPATEFGLEIVLGEGQTKRALIYQLRALLNQGQPLTEAYFIDPDYTVVFFRNTLFVCDPPPSNMDERENALLSAKKHVLSEGISNAKLRSEVAALEAITTPESKAGRQVIPDVLKRAVWVRDLGSCEACGAKQDLQYDHIIPHSKGGADSAENLQILCGSCNRSKSDRI